MRHSTQVFGRLPSTMSRGSLDGSSNIATLRSPRSCTVTRRTRIFLHLHYSLLLRTMMLKSILRSSLPVARRQTVSRVPPQLGPRRSRLVEASTTPSLPRGLSHLSSNFSLSRSDPSLSLTGARPPLCLHLPFRPKRTSPRCKRYTSIHAEKPRFRSSSRLPVDPFLMGSSPTAATTPNYPCRQAAFRNGSERI